MFWSLAIRGAVVFVVDDDVVDGVVDEVVSVITCCAQAWVAIQ